MNFKSLVSLLANRINQPYVIEVYLKKVFNAGYNKGIEEGKEIGRFSVAIKSVTENINALSSAVYPIRDEKINALSDLKDQIDGALADLEDINRDD